MVANNDYAIGNWSTLEHSKYWPNTASIIEDDAQMARTTSTLAAPSGSSQPYVKRGIIESTPTHQSFVRSIDCCCMSPMSQYDAADALMVFGRGAFRRSGDPTMIDVNAKNTDKSRSRREKSDSRCRSAPMHLSCHHLEKYQRAILRASPVHRFRPLIDPTAAEIRMNKESLCEE